MNRADRYVLDRPSLADQLYSYIKQTILSNGFKPGERIPEAMIAEHFGVSRTPVREALKRLKEYGLIVLKPRSYAFVTQFDHEEAEQVAEIRAQLECLSVRLFSKHATEEDLKAIESIAEECERLVVLGDPANVFEKDSQLHLEIAKRCGNHHLYEMMERLDTKVQLIRLTVCLTADDIAHDVVQHRKIIDRLKKKDTTSAILLIQEHVLQHFNTSDTGQMK